MATQTAPVDPTCILNQLLNFMNSPGNWPDNLQAECSSRWKHSRPPELDEPIQSKLCRERRTPRLPRLGSCCPPRLTCYWNSVPINHETRGEERRAALDNQVSSREAAAWDSPGRK